MAFSDVAAKIAQGLAGVGNNPQASQEVGQWQQNRALQKNAPSEMSLQAHSLAVNGLRQKLSALDPNSPDYAKQHDDLVHQMAQQVGAMREIVAPDQNLGPLDRLKQLTTDKLHITNHVGRLADLQRKQQAGAAQDQGTAQAFAEGAPTTQNGYLEKYHQAMMLPGMTPEKALQIASGIKPELENFKTQTLTLNDGKQISAQQDTKSGKWLDLNGNPIPKELLDGAKLTPKPIPPPKESSTPKVGTSHGKNVYALLTPQGWVDAGTKEPLADFRPLPTYAQIAPSMHATVVVDPENPSSTRYESTPEAIRTHAKTPQSIDYKLQMPTAQERGRADLATSAREQLSTMESILTSNPDLFGPGAGHITDFNTWVGSQSPDAQRFRAAARIAADHLAGVFGGRSTAALEGIYNVIGKNITNPEAAIAGLEQMNLAAAKIQERGSGPKDKGKAKDNDKNDDPLGLFK